MLPMTDLSRILLNEGDFSSRCEAHPIKSTPLTPTSLKRGSQMLDSPSTTHSAKTSPVQPYDSIAEKENNIGQSPKRIKRQPKVSLDGLELKLDLSPGPYSESSLAVEDAFTIAGWSYGTSSFPEQYRNILARRMHERSGTVKQVAKSLREDLALGILPNKGEMTATTRDSLERLILELASPYEVGVSKAQWQLALAPYPSEVQSALARVPRNLCYTFWLLRDLEVFPQHWRQVYEQQRSAYQSLSEEAARLFLLSASVCIEQALNKTRKPTKIAKTLAAKAARPHLNHELPSATIEQSTQIVAENIPSTFDDSVSSVQAHLPRADSADTPTTLQTEVETSDLSKLVHGINGPPTDPEDKERRRAAREAKQLEKEQKLMAKKKKEEAHQKLLRHQAELKARSTGLMHKFLQRATVASPPGGSSPDKICLQVASAVGEEKSVIPTRSSPSDYNEAFKPFHVKANTKVAVRQNRQCQDFALEDIESHPTVPSFDLSPGHLRERETIQTMMQKIADCASIGLDGKAYMRMLQNRKLYPIKVLKFHEDYRPAYRGTWTIVSDAVSARRPFGRDSRRINYDYDSEIEWVEEEEGEDVMSADDDEAEPEEPPSELDGCSEAGWIEDDLQDLNDTQVRRPKVLKTLIPVAKGLIWEDAGYDDQGLAQFSLETLNGDFSIDPFAEPLCEQAACRDSVALSTIPKATSAPQLNAREIELVARLVHGSTRSRAVLIELAQESVGRSITKQSLGQYFRAVVKKRGRGSDARWAVPDEQVQAFGLSPLKSLAGRLPQLSQAS